ncbi:MAG: hypothetical protein KAJ48_09520, partial [Elusimicrobiales bacterium]|nr:hypothetical protein [Elusimicrobiales bacterium]
FGYPEKRERSSLDIEFPPNIEDEQYLEVIQETLPEIFKKSNFDMAFYIAGADIYAHDLLGDMKVSMAGIQKRDAFVFKILKDLKIPIVLAFAGGYAKNIDDTAKIYFNTVKEALKSFPLFNKKIHF